MQYLSLETIAERLSEQLRGAQEKLCHPIVHQVTRGKPVTPASLRASLQVSQNELEQRLAKLPPDVEFDRVGNIVGLGVTLMPTSHRFQIGGKLLYTWCAFDTVLFPRRCTSRHRSSQRVPSPVSPLPLSPHPKARSWTCCLLVA